MKFFNYYTSKNYEKLWDLMKEQRIVCFVKNYNTTDICSNAQGKSCEIGARGIDYIVPIGHCEEELKKDFIEQCEEFELEYIVPNNQRRINENYI